MRKYAVIGTHGVGKTTFVYELAANMKKAGGNVRVVNEQARCSPFPLNENFNIESAQWIICKHIQEELEALHQGFDICVSDRTPMDTIMYCRAAGFHEKHIRPLDELADYWMKGYEKLVFMMASNENYDMDSRRSKSKSLRQQVEKLYLSYIANFMPEDKVIIVSDKHHLEGPWMFLGF